MKSISGFSTAQTIAFIAKKDGAECPFVRIANDDPSIQDFKCYAMMERDLLSAKSLFIESQKYSENPAIHGALISEAVVAYCRPFKPGNNRSIRKLDFKNISNDQSSIIIHDALQTLRDKFYAHTDQNDYEDFFLCVALNPDHNKKSILDIYRGMPRTSGLDTASINDFLQVTNLALDWINNILNLEYAKLSQQLNTLDINEIYKAAIDPASFDSTVHKIHLEYPFT